MNFLNLAKLPATGIPRTEGRVRPVFSNANGPAAGRPGRFPTDGLLDLRHLDPRKVVFPARCFNLKMRDWRERVIMTPLRRWGRAAAPTGPARALLEPAAGRPGYDAPAGERARATRRRVNVYHKHIGAGGSGRRGWAGVREESKRRSAGDES